MDSGVDMTRFADMPWPGIKSEQWKYTHLAPLAESHFRPVARLEGVLPIQIKDFFLPEAANLVFVNGFLFEPLSEMGKIDPSWIVRYGDAALEAGRALHDKQADNEFLIFHALNEAFLKDAVFIEVPRGVGAKTPVHMIHVLNGGLGRQAIFPRTGLKVCRGAEAFAIETVMSFDEGEYFHNPVAEILLEEGASLEYVQTERHSPRAFHIGSLCVSQDKDSRFHSFVLTRGSRIFRNNVSVFLRGEGAQARVNGLHRLDGDRHADSHTYVDHVAPNAKSDQLYKCIVDDRAHSVFNGRIAVRREAQLTNSYQLNKNLVLSRECRVDTRPQLEISADDVKCTHGATIGQLNDEELFYLQTRGMGRDDAQGMLIHGFVEDVLNKISNPVMRAAVRKTAAA